ncbi:HEAT repeat domain-containing protein [Streptomyces erythrochromogenes]|uniref:HEAT repeat domain-containing protein n=1 Tax=Streptomyces erythrochromogenes TaxID=285574 RepID=UPI00362AD65E
MNRGELSGAENPSGLTQISARGTGSLSAGCDATHNATGKGSSVYDNRTIFIIGDAAADDSVTITAEEIASASRSYADQIRATYGRLDLEALIPTTEGEHPRVELREVFVPPMLRADPPRVELPVELHRRLVDCGELLDPKDDVPLSPGVDREMWERARQAYRERPAIKLLETLVSADSDRMVILGDPGAGKSTLARYLALVLTSQMLTGPLSSLSGLLPIVIELRRYADALWREKSFEEFLAYVHLHEGHAPAPSLLGHSLSGGLAVVIFDGLDELFDPRVRDNVTRRIAGFSARYPKVRVVVTSRVIGYNRHVLDAAGFRHYMLQSLDDDQISEFTSRWYEAVCPSDKREAEKLRVRLSDAINRSRPVRELAGNPLLLTILAIIARRQRLPRDRAGVYQHAVNVLIAHWDEDAKHLDLSPEIRAIADLDDRDRREMLERLARHMQSGDGGIAGNHVLGEDVVRVFTNYLRETLQLDVAPAKKVGRAMVRQFRERNFILSLYGSQVYGFVHRAFLEYLAASDIVRRYEQRDLSDEEMLDGIFVQHTPDPAWHEVLLLIVGQLGDKVAASAIDRILSSEGNFDAPPAVLALRALVEVRRVGVLERQSLKTAEALTRHWGRNHVVRPSVDADTETSLSSLGPQWVGSRYIRRWLHASGGGIKSSAPAYDLFTDMDVLMAMASGCWQAAGRANVLPHLVQKWPHDSKVFEFLQNAAEQDSDPSVRSTALEVLADHWVGEPAVADLVRRRAIEDPHELACSDALDILADHWSEDLTVRDLVQHFATEDSRDFVRRWAIATLVRKWPEVTKEVVQSSATDDPSEHVRMETVVLLAEHWTSDPIVREILQRLSLEDLSEQVRSRACTSLGQYWSDDPTVREFLVSRSAEDSSEMVRSDALDAVADCWTHEPTVVDFVQGRATEDPHHHVRHWALVKLGEHWASNSAVRELVRRRAVEDEHEQVRGRALRTLARYWPGYEIGRELIDSRATDDPHEDVRSEALAILGGSWPEDPAVRELVGSRATDDPHEEVRSRALVTLARYWTDDPSVRELVQSRATEDPHEDVRSRAADTLGYHWTEKPVAEKAINNLRERACCDSSDSARDFLVAQFVNSAYPEVRVVAAQILGSLWPSDPQSIAALRVQQEVEEDQKVQASIGRALDTAATYAPLNGRLW